VTRGSGWPLKQPEIGCWFVIARLSFRFVGAESKAGVLSVRSVLVPRFLLFFRNPTVKAKVLLDAIWNLPPPTQSGIIVFGFLECGQLDRESDVFSGRRRINAKPANSASLGMTRRRRSRRTRVGK
jgi:hypothetical protein